MITEKEGEKFFVFLFVLYKVLIAHNCTQILFKQKAPEKKGSAMNPSILALANNLEK